MSTIHSQWKQIPESELGELFHVDHQDYVRWMREMTRQHFASMGFDRKYFLAKEHCFVVRRHSIEHLAPCFVNDRVLLMTWISEVGNKAVKRQHRIYKLDESDNRIPVVRAENLSIFVDAKVRATNIPTEISEVLEVVTKEQVSQYLGSLATPTTETRRLSQVS